MGGSPHSRALRLTLVAGARPNFMKVAPMVRVFSRQPERFKWRLVHTGQHYDHDMNQVFFDELGIPTPDARLGAGGGSHAVQTAAIMVAFEKELIEHPADWVVVVGDVNSTLACSVVAAKMGVKVAHVEAGLRSGDRRMPEEINRIVTDSISNLFFVTEPSGREHLLAEGHRPDRIHDVGHVMIDNLFHQHRALLEDPNGSWVQPELRDLKHRLQEQGRGYGVVTLHRPSNVDNRDTLAGILAALNRIATERLPLVFPVHPRTRDRLQAFGLLPTSAVPLYLTGPLPYMPFLDLWKDASLVLTDSGGLQEETTALGVRCLTLRESTERPITITRGTNRLVGVDPAQILQAAEEILSQPPNPRRPDMWDGQAAERIATVLTGHPA